MKKLLALFVLLPVLLFAQNTDWYTKNPNADVFEISTADELRGLASLVNSPIPTTFAGKTIALAKDIDLGGVNFAPIGNNSTTNSFRGVFDGQGYTISGLSVSGVQYAGLFGYVGADGQIKNVNVVASEIRANTTGANIAGGLAAYYGSTQTIENSSIQANSVIASGSYSSYSGGLVGYASSALTIANSYASGNVSATGYNSYSGGIFGRYASGTITSVYYRSEGASQPAGTGSPSGITALAGTNMMKKAFFVNWDFDGVWGIVENVTYPFLRFYTPLNDVEAEYIHDQTYTGKQIKPNPAIKLKTNGMVLTNGEHYDLSYGENINAGTGTITLTGKDIYSGLLENITFNIIPKKVY